MSTISIFNGSYCNETGIVQEVMIATGYELLDDAAVAAEAARFSEIPAAKIERAFTTKTSIFNKFTHERERSVAHLKLALARRLAAAERVLVWGFASHLIPRDISHVLRVCLIAEARSRAARAAQAGSLPEADARRLIHRQDEERAAWVLSQTGQADPWAPGLYDMLLPTDKQPTEEIARLVAESLRQESLRPTPRSLQAVQDFLLAATVEVALAREGHHVGVRAADGAVTLIINKNVLMLNRLENELKAVVEKVPGVLRVGTEVGPEFYQSDVYRKFDFEMPAKILLVDDEREFVQTLSERLLMRDLGSAVAFDGESALEVVREDEPEVMILDLRMPGIDGVEVLRRVKTERPEIEVIILTGHGSDADRETCMGLGAFAYLQKPVDIDELSATIKRANERIRQRRADRI
jgi:CheY-like chemotaxis protein